MNQLWIQDVEHYGYEKLTRNLARLAQTYPFLHISSIGKSVLGHYLYVICVSLDRQYGNIEHSGHWNGAFHANEWITTPLLMKTVEDIAMSISSGRLFRGRDMRTLLAHKSIWIVPMVNPDGVELVLNGFTPEHPFAQELNVWNGGSRDFSQWKANIRGVDLNDQFPAYWDEEVARRQVHKPCGRDYPGRAPLTEPEAQAMATFTLCQPFSLVISLHTQGKEIYWNYREMEPPWSSVMADHIARSCGYRAVRLTESDAGFKDWFIQEFRKPGFTVEAGIGENPLSVDKFTQMYEEISELLLVSIEIM